VRDKNGAIKKEREFKSFSKFKLRKKIS
jgi:hypothetical protein